MDKVSVAALERETAGESLKALHDVHDGSINRADIHGGQGRLPLLDVTRVIDKALGFRECFHLLRPLPQPNAKLSGAASLCPLECLVGLLFRVSWPKPFQNGVVLSVEGL